MAHKNRTLLFSPTSINLKRKRVKLLLIIGVAIFLFFFCFVPYESFKGIINENNFLARATASASGTVHNTSCVTTPITNPTQVTTEVCDEDVTFLTTNANSITFHTLSSHSYSPDSSPVTVLYDPHHPTDARIQNAVNNDLKNCIIGASIWAIIAILLLIFALLNRNRWIKRSSATTLQSESI